MSRSGYVDDLEDYQLNLYRGRVARATKGKRGQSFLRELATAMDNMEDKVLIANELINEEGDCCAIGVVWWTSDASQRSNGTRHRPNQARLVRGDGTMRHAC